jgi:hypothetical protein
MWGRRKARAICRLSKSLLDAGRGARMPIRCCQTLRSAASVLHCLKLVGRLQLLSALLSVRPKVICGKPTGRVCSTQQVKSLRGIRSMGMRVTHSAVVVTVERTDAEALEQALGCDAVFYHVGHCDATH